MVILMIFFVLQVFAQPDCTKKPSADDLLKSMQYKPVLEVDPCWFCSDYNITDSLKQRLLYLIKSDWTKQEIADYLHRYIEKNKADFEIDAKSSVMAKGNDSVFKRVRDSIIEVYSKNQFGYLKSRNYFGVNSNLIKAVALIGLKEAIPILQGALRKTDSQYDLAVVEMALAKFGDKALQRKIIKECAANTKLNYDEWQHDFSEKFMRLYFVNTQESIYAASMFLDTTKMYWYTSKTEGKAAYLAIDFLNDIILNQQFKAMTRGVDLKGLNNSSNEFVTKCRKWLIQNKGKYIIKPFCSRVMH